MKYFLRRIFANRLRPIPSRPSSALRVNQLEDRVTPATFTVTTLADSGAGSLRDAINQANGLAGADTINFQAGLTGVIDLQSALPDIAGDLTISGPGADLLTIRRSPLAATNFRLFTLNLPAATETVTLDKLTLTGGNAVSGGAINAGDENLVVSNSVITGNSSPGVGGAIYNYDAYDTGSVTIRNSVISGNTAAKGGGIYFFYNGSLLVQNSTISGNSATRGTGGGIYFYGKVGSGGFLISNSTIANNTAASSGGGVFCKALTGTVNINNSTVTGNLSSGGQGGGGIARVGTTGTISLTSTVVAENSATTGGRDVAVPGGVTATNTFFGSAQGVTVTGTGNFTSGTNATPLDPKLRPLGNYGGPTPTRRPLPGSPLIDAGSNPDNLTTDQRGAGFVRSQGTTDIGSFEVQPASPPFVETVNAPTLSNRGGTSYTFTITFDDDAPLDVTSIVGNNAAVRVLTPSGVVLAATFVGVDVSTNGAPRTVTYQIPAPSGVWGTADNGAYKIQVLPNQIKSTTGIAVPAGTVGTFNVAIIQNLVVTTTADAGPGSLRAVLQLANALAGPDVIQFDKTVFATPQTIALTGGELRVNDSVTIQGPGADLLTVRASGPAGPTHRVFNVSGAGTLTVNISGMTISGGNLTATGPTGRGGGILVQDENLTLTGVTVSGNTTVADGAGVAMEGPGTLTVVDSTFSGNSSTGSGFDGSGGAIANDGGGTVIIRRSTMSGNTANVQGGVLYSPLGGSVQVVDSTLSGNTANSPYTTLGAGGAIYFAGSVSTGGFSITNSTLANNRGPSAPGGAIALSGFTGNLTIQNSTITGNVGGQPTGGGGISRLSGTGTVTLVSTVVARNTAAGGAPDIDMGAGGSVNATKSLIGIADGLTVVGGGNLTGTLSAPLDPKLGPLQDNGGPTLTEAPLPGSPVIDAGSNTAGLSGDQRGLARTVGGGTDIGAVEDQPAAVVGITAPAPRSNAAVVTFTITFNQPVTGLTAANLKLTATGVSGASIAAVTKVGSGRVWAVDVATGTGDGSVRIDLTDAAGLTPGVTGVPAQGPAVIVDKTAPTVVSAVPADANPTAAGAVTFTVTFSEPVVGLSVAQLALARVGTANGVIGAPTTADGGTTWTVPVSGVSGNGELGLTVASTAGLADRATNPVANVPFAGGAYHVGKPIVLSLTTAAPTITNAAQVTYDVRFNQPVDGVGLGNFGLVTSTGVTGASITGVSGTGDLYHVTVDTGTGTGTVRLDVTSGANITTPLPTTGLALVPTRGPTLQIDKVPPTLTGFTRLDPPATVVSSVRYGLSFSEPVAGLTKDNLQLVTAGLSGASITTIEGSGRNYTVVVGVGAGTGTVQLRLANSTGLSDAAGNPVATVPADGPVYAIDRSQPSAQAITRLDPTPSAAAAVRFEVTFSESVSGVAARNFSLDVSGGLSGASIASVAASPGSGGARYTVTVNTGSGSGSVALNLSDRTGITDAAGNVLSGTLTGPTYVVDRAAPVVVSIDRLDGAFTGAGTARYAVTFSEPVTGLSPGNFSLDAPGLTGSAVTGVSGGGAAYTVTVATGDGNGSLALVLANSTGVADLTGNPVANLPAEGPAYAIDRQPPTVTVALAPGQPAVSTGGVIQFAVAFSEPVVGFDASDVVLGGTALGRVVQIDGSGAAYTVSVAWTSGIGTLTAAIAGGGVTDEAGNPNLPSAAPAAVALDLPPGGGADVYRVAAGGSLTVAGPGVLGNDADPEGKPINAVLLDGPPASAGRLALNPDGSFTFRAAAGFSGPTSFTYAPTDGRSLGAPVRVELDVVPKTTLTAVAAGPGGAPVVVVYNADGSVRFQVMALEPTFTGGVRVATGDVTGDGVDDIVVVAGPTGGPHVRVLDGVDAHEVFNFFAYDPSFTGGMYLAVGDVDGDGHADIVTGAGAGGGPHVRVFSGADLAVIRDFFAYAPAFRGGVSVAVGDADGDGITDIVTGPASGGAPHIRVFRGTDLAAIRSFFAFDPPFNGGVTVAVGTAAGGPAIFVGSGSGANVKVFGGPNGTKVLATLEFASGSPAQGVRVATKDTNGDGEPDELLLSPGPGEIARVRRFKLPSLAVEPPLTTFPASFLGGLYVG